MGAIIAGIKEIIDVNAALIFIIIFGYLLLVDLRSLKRQKLRREAALIKYIGWGGMVVFAGVIALHILS